MQFLKNFFQKNFKNRHLKNHKKKIDFLKFSKKIKKMLPASKLFPPLYGAILVQGGGISQGNQLMHQIF